eukprot:jgi/Botrbrau1/11447/Bobra.0328s0007.1
MQWKISSGHLNTDFKHSLLCLESVLISHEGTSNCLGISEVTCLKCSVSHTFDLPPERGGTDTCKNDSF